MMNLSDIAEKMEQLDNWALEGSIIVKEIHFDSFEQSVDFINKLSEVTKKMSHYPDIIILKNLVRLSLTSHEQGGLCEIDFETAKLIDGVQK
jgi:4a-hydroxytetrahydrobiopterin dehydratase